MSLSEQIQRVDGSQNDILRALAQSYGIDTSGLKIDQLAAAVKASKKFKQDGLLSAATIALFGLGADSVPDDVFKKIKSMFDDAQTDVSERAKVVVGSRTGGGTTTVTLNFESPPKLVIYYGRPASSDFIYIEGTYAYSNGSTSFEFKVSGNTLTITGMYIDEQSSEFWYLAIL